jgi:hypothetical protein
MMKTGGEERPSGKGIEGREEEKKRERLCDDDG